MKKITLSMLLIIVSIVELQAQKFTQPLEGFSRKKTAYVFLKDGSKKEGKLIKFKRQRGIIKNIKLNVSGTDVDLDPSQLSHVYLAPSALAKYAASVEKMGDVNKMYRKTNYDTLFRKRYVYLESVHAIVKNEEGDFMFQLMNPASNKYIQVYHDPFAAETMSAKMGNVKVAGGLDKSYYVKKTNDKVAYRLLKKDYKKSGFDKLFGDCPEFVKKFPAKRWSNFEKHVAAYNACK